MWLARVITSFGSNAHSSMAFMLPNFVRGGGGLVNTAIEGDMGETKS